MLFTRLRHQLTDNACASGTQGTPHCNLALPIANPRQLQIGDIAAGDEQHECHRTQHHQQECASLTQHCSQLELNLCGIVVSICVGVLFGQSSGDRAFIS